MMELVISLPFYSINHEIITKIPLVQLKKARKLSRCVRYIGQKEKYIHTHTHTYVYIPVYNPNYLNG